MKSGELIRANGATRLVKKNARLVSAWVWPLPVKQFVEERASGYTLNVPCGMSSIGDVLCDAEPQQPGVMPVNMAALPFRDECFDTVISDPPWKIDYYHRWKPFLEAVRVVKVGGLVIYNATWLPWSRQVELLETWIRQDEYFATNSVIAVFRRVTNSNPGWQPKSGDKQIKLWDKAK